jgi:hypothetical protein
MGLQFHCGRNVGSSGGEEVTATGDGTDQTVASRAGLDLLPQAGDVRTDDPLGFSLRDVVTQSGSGQLAAG